MSVEPITHDIPPQEEKNYTVPVLDFFGYMNRHNYLARYPLKHNTRNGVQIIQPRTTQTQTGCAFAAIARQIEYQLRIVYSEAKVPISLHEDQGICYIDHRKWEQELRQSNPSSHPSSRWNAHELLECAKKDGVPLYNGDRHRIQFHEIQGKPTQGTPVDLSLLKKLLADSPIVGVFPHTDDFPVNGEYVYEGKSARHKEEMVDPKGVKSTVTITHAVVLLDVAEFQGRTYVAYQNSYGDSNMSMCPHSVSWLLSDTLVQMCYGLSLPPVHPPPILQSARQREQFLSDFNKLSSLIQQLETAYNDGKRSLQEVNIIAFDKNDIDEALKTLTDSFTSLQQSDSIMKELSPFISKYGDVVGASSLASSPIQELARNAQNRVHLQVKLMSNFDYHKNFLTRKSDKQMQMRR